MNKGLINLISTNKLFEGVDITQINFDQIKGNLLTFSERTLIYSEGDPSSGIYLVMDGKINILRQSNLGAKGDEIFEKDSFFGFEELIENVNRISTAIAITDSYVISFDREEARILIRQNERIKENIVKYSNIPDIDQIHGFLVEKELEDEIIKKQVESENIENEETEKISEFPNEKELTSEKPVNTNDFDLVLISPPIEEEETHPVENQKDIMDFYVSAPADEEPKQSGETEVIEEKEESGQTATQENIAGTVSPVQDEQPEEPLQEFHEELWSEENNESDNINIPPQDLDIPPVSPFDEEEIDFPKAGLTAEVKSTVQEKENEVVDEPQAVSEFPSQEQTAEVKNNLDFSGITEAADKIFLTESEEELILNFKNLVNTVFNCEITLFFKYDGGEFLTAEFEKDGEILKIKEPVNDSSIGVSFNNNKPEIISLPEEWEKLNTKSLQQLGIDINNLLIFPVKTEVDKIGVLVLINKQAGGFGEEDIAHLSSLRNLLEARLRHFAFARSQLSVLKENIYNRLINFLHGKLKERLVLASKYNEKALSEEKPHDLIKLALEEINSARESIGEIELLKLESSDLRLVELKLSDFLNEFFEECAGTFKEKFINVFKDFNAEVFVKIDQKLMKTALLKISENACEAMPFGGNFIVKSRESEESVTLIFVDNGNGIDEEKLPLVFEPFVAFSKESHTGLGLAIAKRIIQLHKGKITAKRNENGGTTVEIKLPVVRY